MVLLFKDWPFLHLQVKHKLEKSTLLDALGKVSLHEERLQSVMPLWN